MPKKVVPPVTKAVSQSRIVALTSLVKSPSVGFRFLTLTLNPVVTRLPAQKQFKVTIYDLRSMLSYFCEEYSYVTELTEAGAVHYHAWVIMRKDYKLCQMLDYLKYNKRFGFYCLSKDNNSKTTSDKQTDTYNYMLKDIAVTYSAVRSMFLAGHDSDGSRADDVKLEDVDTSCLDN